MRDDTVTIRIGDETQTIGGLREPGKARELIASMAATIAAGIEADPSKSDEWEREDTVRRALRTSVDIFLATMERR